MRLHRRPDDIARPAITARDRLGSRKLAPFSIQVVNEETTVLFQAGRAKRTVDHLHIKRDSLTRRLP